jgi:hypothetical protein
MVHSTTLAAGLLAALSGVTRAQYVLESNYDASNFFSEFSFFTEPDPTHGHVQYVDSATAQSMGLAAERDGAVYMGADATEHSPAGGRKSVRLTSNKAWTHGLVIGDFAHMPSSICSSWPAFWTVDHNNWPQAGEIDILEGVNTQDATAITLHTGPGCTITNEGTDQGTVLKEANCNAGDAFTGCGQQTSNPENYGDGFNAVGGGIYAMEWTSQHIAVWHFPRYAVPSDISSGTPNPAAWPAPSARFVGGGGCNIDEHFVGHSIVFTNTFCGDWAGGVWGDNAECSSQASSCVDFVNNNPEAYAETYWLVNSVKVYQAQEPGFNRTMHARSFRA